MKLDLVPKGRDEDASILRDGLAIATNTRTEPGTLRISHAERLVQLFWVR